jgi:hypothetical protein
VATLSSKIEAFRECSGPDIPWRPSLPNFTLEQMMSQPFSLYVGLSMLLMLKMLWFYRDKLSWNESYHHKLFAKDTRDSFNWLYLLIASQHNDWVFLLLLEMQQKLMICRIVCSKCWADYYISLHPLSSGADWSWWVVMAAHQVLPLLSEGDGLSLLQATLIRLWLHSLLY